LRQLLEKPMHAAIDALQRGDFAEAFYQLSAARTLADRKRDAPDDFDAKMTLAALATLTAQARGDGSFDSPCPALDEATGHVAEAQRLDPTGDPESPAAHTVRAAQADIDRWKLRYACAAVPPVGDAAR
jgi:hypothetical protein